ncbi:hypothetical protein, partial [Furfurilactobacillus entadae]|uniref:hypothetical protein n=1 Tax=Furfurilactobacillus entadae TaxID=2922307 RepID=UPI0038B322FC
SLNSTQLNSTQLNSTQLNSTQLNSTQLKLRWTYISYNYKMLFLKIPKTFIGILHDVAARRAVA